jgi:hypothetical protein
MMTIGYIGDTGAGGVECGENPCSFLDSIYAGWGTDECLPYLACMNPSDPRVVGFVGSAAAGLGQDVAIGVGATASGLAGSMSIGGWIVLAALGAVFLLRR